MSKLGEALKKVVKAETVVEETARKKIERMKKTFEETAKTAARIRAEKE